MLRSGLCSITHRKLSVDDVIDLARRGGLAGIEWGGDVHVPHGDVDVARQVRQKTLAAGLACPSYGSYYRVGLSEDDGLVFENVLNSAEALGATTIRVWGGNLNKEDASEAFINKVVSETRRIASLARARNRNIAFEFHSKTLTNSPAAARQLMEAVDTGGVSLYWQPKVEDSFEENLAGLKNLLPWISNLHVFHWETVTAPDGNIQTDNRLLEEGVTRWTAYLDAVTGDGMERWLYLEFSKDNSPEATVADAKVLNQLTMKEGRRPRRPGPRGRSPSRG